MKTKKIAMIILISSIMASETCHGMSYLSSSYNSLTSMISNKMMGARNWTSKFIERCQKIGILSTVAATFGVYSFKDISGLDYGALDTYKASMLKAAQDRVEKRIEEGGYSEKLAQYAKLLQAKYLATLNKEENAATEQENENILNKPLTADEIAATAKEIEKEIQQIRGKK